MGLIPWFVGYVSAHMYDVSSNASGVHSKGILCYPGKTLVTWFDPSVTLKETLLSYLDPSDVVWSLCYVEGHSGIVFRS